MAFKKQLIYFDEAIYQSITNNLNTYVKQVNKVLNQLIELEGKDISLDFIKHFTMDQDYIRDTLSKQFFNDVLKQFSIQPEFMQRDNYANNQWAYDMIRGRTRQYYEVRESFLQSGISFFNYGSVYNYFIDDNLVAIEEGKMIITDIAKEYLKEKFSYYTKSEEENKVIDKVNEIHSLIKELDYNVLLAFAKGNDTNWYNSFELGQRYIVDKHLIGYSHLRAVNEYRKTINK